MGPGLRRDDNKNCHPPLVPLVPQILSHRHETREAADDDAEEQLIEQKFRDVRIEIMKNAEARNEDVEIWRKEIEYGRN